MTGLLLYEPLPASFLIGVAIIWGKDVGKESEYFRLVGVGHQWFR
jgi:hypothetical protein